MTAAAADDPLAAIARALTAERFAPLPERPQPEPVAPVAFLDPPDVVQARIAAMNAEMTPNYHHDRETA